MIYRFDDFALDTNCRELRRGSVACSVEPQVFDLLEYLICNRHRMVSRDDVFKAVWRGRIVSDAALSTRINAARTAIGDNGREQRLIRTLRRQGLRFVGVVRERTDRQRTLNPAVAAVAKAEGRPSAISDEPTLVVLPFVNLSGNPRQEGFADAITENLITALSQAGWFFVFSRTSSFAHKGEGIEGSQVARRLGARYLLEGSVYQADGRVRVAARLTDSISNHNLWAERYERDIAGILALQDDISSKVVAAIEPQLYAAENIRAQCKSPDSLNAWDCIVRALSLMNSRQQPDIIAARRLLQKAVVCDPKSAPAHSLLSFVTTLNIHMGWKTRQAVVPCAQAAAQKALSLNPEEPWAHAALGYITIWKNPENAVLPLQRALALNPNFSIAHYLSALASTYAGERRDVFAHADQAERLASRDLLARGFAGAHNNIRATASFAAGDFSDGIDFARLSITESPNSPTAYRALTMNLALAGEVEKAREALRMLRRLAPNMSQRRLKEIGMWSRDEDMKRYAEAFRAAGLK